MIPGTSKRLHPPDPWAWLAVAALPALVHLLLLQRYSVNAPRLDDFADGFGFLNSFYGTDDWHQRFRSLFTLYQNHRWGFLHAVYALFHCIDFRLANFLSMPWLLALLFLWYRCTRQHTYALPLLAIASLLVFNLHTWTGMFWITASLAAFPSIPLALLAFMLLEKNTTSGTVAAAAVAIAATFTNGNGVLIWPLGLLYLLWQANTSRMARIALWLTTGTLVLFVFFSPDIFPVTADQEDRVTGVAQKLLSDPLLFVKGALATAGSSMLYFNGGESWRITMAVAIGLLEVALLTWLLWRGALRKQPALLLLLLFTGGTLAAIAASRVMFLGIAQAFQGHYKLYNSVLLLLLAAAAFDVATPANTKRLAAAMTALATILYLAALGLFLPDTRNYHQTLIEDTRQWLHSHALQRAESRYLVRNPNRKLETAVDGGFYNPWTLVDEQHQPQSVTFLPDCQTHGDAFPATLESQKNARAVHLQASTTTKPAALLLCSPLQAIAIHLGDNNYRQNENGTYSLELWVPRETTKRDDAGPWQIYQLP